MTRIAKLNFPSKSLTYPFRIQLATCLASFAFLVTPLSSAAHAELGALPLAGGLETALVLRTEPVAFDTSSLTQGPKDPSSVDLSSLDGKVTLVNFWATWCAPCMKEMPDIKAAQDALGADTLAVVAVSLDTKAKPAEAFLENIGAADQFNLVYDPKFETLQNYDGPGVPYTLVLDKNKTVIGDLQGIFDWSSKPGLDLLKHLSSQ